MESNGRYVREIKTDVQSAAKKTAREWPDVIEEDDAEQEIWLRILESSDDYLERVAGMDKPARINVLERIGQQVAQGYRNDYEIFSGNSYYGTKDVKKLLESGALAGVTEEAIPLWELPLCVIEQIKRTDTETLTERIDLFYGLKDLHDRNTRYAGVIFDTYQLGHSSGKSASDRKRLTRAVDALTECMNNCHRRNVSEYDGPGRRRVVSNAEALAITTNHKEGVTLRLDRYRQRKYN